MLICVECNKGYKVLVDVDGRNLDAESMEIETPYCPFCGKVSLDMDFLADDSLDYYEDLGL